MISDNIAGIRRRVQDVCLKIKQDCGEVSIVAVTKGRTAQEIIAAIQAGIVDIGESRILEAKEKFEVLMGRPDTKQAIACIKWHLVGHLQTNKVKEAVKIFDLIHSVDSVGLAQEIDKHAAKINKIQDILIQVNTSGEVSKFGIKPGEAIEVMQAIAQLKNINIKGLMTIAPIVDTPEQARPCFRILRELKDKINELSNMGHRLSTLSMGMSDDFEVAIEEGANMIRVGRAIFD